MISGGRTRKSAILLLGISNSGKSRLFSYVGFVLKYNKHSKCSYVVGGFVNKQDLIRQIATLIY